MIFGRIKNVIFKLPAVLERVAFWKKQTQVEQIHSKDRTALNPEKQAKLENLCNQLFKQKELITSGKLQFIGLAKIKSRMGRRWDGLSKIVYDTTEDVIDSYLDKGDIFVRYKDDTYIIVFARATPEESELKAALIAEEIRRRLFELDEEELRDLEIRQAISEIRTDMLMDAPFSEDMFGAMNDELGDWEDDSKKGEDLQDTETPPPEIRSVEVGAEDYKKAKPAAQKPDKLPVRPDCAYMPLWDTQRGALTTYLCLARDTDSPEAAVLKGHKTLYKGRSAEEMLALDKAVLEIVASELAEMEKEGRKLFIICPVQHETVFRFESYEEYKKLLADIPLTHRKFLMLLVTNMASGMPPKNAYWFAKPLRTFCPYIFAEVPLRRDLNFRYLNGSGINVAGVWLGDTDMKEQEIIAILNNFRDRAKSHKIPKTFVLGVQTLSVTTSTVCAGFDFLGGPAIHKMVEKPDTVHRYQYEDLLSDLKK